MYNIHKFSSLPQLPFKLRYVRIPSYMINICNLILLCIVDRKLFKNIETYLTLFHNLEKSVLSFISLIIARSITNSLYLLLTVRVYESGSLYTLACKFFLFYNFANLFKYILHSLWQIVSGGFLSSSTKLKCRI